MTCLYIGQMRKGEFNHLYSVCMDIKESAVLLNILALDDKGLRKVGGLQLKGFLKGLKVKSKWYRVKRGSTTLTTPSELIASLDDLENYYLKTD